jgi:hypothetical protein
MFKLEILILTCTVLLLSACLNESIEIPGKQSNPKLNELIKTQITQNIQNIQNSDSFKPKLTPNGVVNTKKWLLNIDEVVARCRYGPDNHSRFNLFEFDIKLTNGEMVKSVFSSRRCRYGDRLPLVMRVKFMLGQPIEAFTDGRELKHPIEMAVPDIQGFADTVLRADWYRNPTLYFEAGKTPEEIAKEWQ